jgi:hypothetical protein
MDELGIADIPAAKPSGAVLFTPFGEPVTPADVQERLSNNLYDQLSEKSEDVALAAINRAMIYVGAVLRRLNVAFNLDDRTVREVALIHTVYELHIALGHEEAGREYRMRARDIIRAAWGDFPEADSAPEKGAAAAVAVPPKRKGALQWA